MTGPIRPTPLGALLPVALAANDAGDYFVRHLGGAEPTFEFKVESATEYLMAEIVGTP